MLDNGASETAAVADVNKDGRLDIVSGENWYEGPRRGVSAQPAPEVVLPIRPVTSIAQPSAPAAQQSLG